ncbi:hypothetical protein GE21DRAFT_1120855 [Neurospora crassa]|nr:hypothetical protein B24P11.40 [imported] - Neurospora crassa [Neurospora crassa]KHE82711.1 hypothetical protein GE21DRAFT_1120855 [Neurospora crassa]
MASTAGIKRERLIRIGRKKRRFSSFTIPFSPPFSPFGNFFGAFIFGGYNIEQEKRKKDTRGFGSEFMKLFFFPTNRKISSVVLAFILVRGRHQSASDWSTIRDTLKSLALAHWNLEGVV